MTLFDTRLGQALLEGMNDFNALTPSEKTLQPSDYQNVHHIRLEAELTTWERGAWFILKPRFFNEIIKRREELNKVVASLLEQDGVEVNDEIINDALIQNTANDLIFSAFIMIKIMLEKLTIANPPQEMAALFRHQANFRSYQATKQRLENFTEYEQKLIVSLWPGMEDGSYWKEGKERPELETVSIVFESLQEIIARIVINSSLQSIALKAGLAFNNLQSEKELDKIGGLCDLDLNEMTDFLCNLPETTLVYNWLVKHDDSQITHTLSQLLGAILEKPKNINNFLCALNLRQGSAKLKLGEIAERQQIDLIKNDLEKFKGEMNSLLVDLMLIKDDLAQKAETNSKYKEVSKSVRTLYESLYTQMDIFFEKPTVKAFEQLQIAYMDAISDAKNKSANHRGWHKIHPIIRGILGVLAAISLIPLLIVERKSEHGYMQTFFEKPPTRTSKKITEFENKFNPWISAVSKKVPKK